MRPHLRRRALASAATAAALALTACALPTPARADAPRASRARPYAALGVGYGSAAPSEQKDLLAADGYEGGRLLLHARGGALFHERFGVGGWLGYQIRSMTGHGPALEERVAYLGAEAPIVLSRHEGIFLAIVPRIGVARGVQSLHDAGAARWAWVVGGDVMLGGRDALGVGVSLACGWLHAPAEPPGELGGKDNLGGLHLSIELQYGM